MNSQGSQMQGAIRHQGGTAVSQGQSILLPGMDIGGSPSTWQGSTSGCSHTATTSPGSCTKASSEPTAQPVGTASEARRGSLLCPLPPLSFDPLPAWVRGETLVSKGGAGWAVGGVGPGGHCLAGLEAQAWRAIMIDGLFQPGPGNREEMGRAQ